MSTYPKISKISVLILTVLLGFSAIGIRADNPEPTTLVFPPFGHCYGIRKGTERHLWMFLGNRARFKDPQGLAAVKLEEQNEKGSKDDDELTVYGVNSGMHHVIYNQSLLSLAKYGRKGDGVGEFKNPKGIAANPEGDVLVADVGNHRVVHLANRKTELEHVKFFGKEGTGPGEFRYPNQVALSDDGLVFVTDTGNNRIQVFRLAGNYLRQYPDVESEGFIEFDRPDGIAVTTSDERWSRHHLSFMCVVDSSRSRLRKISMNGDVKATIRPADLPYQSVELAYLAIDYYDNVWATDTKNHTVHKFDRDLNYIVSFGSEGDDDFEFEEPRGITIWRRFGQVFVAEKKSAQYYWIGVDVLNPKVRATEESLHLTATLTETARVSAEIFKDGQSVRKALAELFQDVGELDQKISIEKLEPGDYTLKLTARPTYSSKKYFSKEFELPFTKP